MCGATTPWSRPVLLSFNMLDYPLVYAGVLVCREDGIDIAGYHSYYMHNNDADCK